MAANARYCYPKYESSLELHEAHLVPCATRSSKGHLLDPWLGNSRLSFTHSSLPRRLFPYPPMRFVPACQRGLPRRDENSQEPHCPFGEKDAQTGANGRLSSGFE